MEWPVDQCIDGQALYGFKAIKALTGGDLKNWCLTYYEAVRDARDEDLDALLSHLDSVHEEITSINKVVDDLVNQAVKIDFTGRDGLYSSCQALQRRFSHLGNSVWELPAFRRSSIETFVSSFADGTFSFL